MSKVIQLSERTLKSKSHLKQLRAQGHIPAAVSSSHIGNISVFVSEKEISAVVKHNPSALIQVELPNQGTQPVLIHEIQRDMLSGRISHIDFLHVDMHEKIHTSVNIHFTGEPAGVKEGGILQIELHQVDIRCMPDKLPEFFEIDLSALKIGDHLLVSDIKVAADTEILSDLNGVLATILGKQKAEDATAATPTAATDASKA